MTSNKDLATVESKTLPPPQSEERLPESSLTDKKPLKRRIREILWDSLDRTPEERWFIHKIDFFILTWASLSYFSKNLNTNNVSKLHRRDCTFRHHDVGGTDMSITCRQCIRFWYEGRSQYRRKRVPDAHNHVDDVSFNGKQDKDGAG